MSTTEMKLWEAADAALKTEGKVGDGHLVLADFFEQESEVRAARLLRKTVADECKRDDCLELGQARNLNELIRKLNQKTGRTFACHLVLSNPIVYEATVTKAAISAVELLFDLANPEFHQKKLEKPSALYMMRGSSELTSHSERKPDNWDHFVHGPYLWGCVRAVGAVNSLTKLSDPDETTLDAIYSAKHCGLTQGQVTQQAAEHLILGRSIRTLPAMLNVLRHARLESYISMTRE